MSVDATRAEPVEPFSPFDPVHTADPVAHLAVSRRCCPVAKVHENVVVVTTAAEVDAVLRDHVHFANQGNFVLTPGPAPRPEDDPTPPILVTTDPPAHTALRAFHRDWFSPRSIRAMEPRVREVANATLDQIPVTPGVDLVRHLAWPFPPRVVFALIGLPEADWEWVHVTFDSTVALIPNSPEHQAALARLTGYLVGVIARRRDSGERRPDILDAYLHAEEAGASFSDAEIVGHLLQLIGAGTDTTEALIASLLYRLLEDPARWAEVLTDRSLAEPATEETLRLDAPLQWVLRSVVIAAEIGGCPVAGRDRVVVHLQSAGHDESAWGSDSAQFNLHRKTPHQHRAFGYGIHSCLGAPLARLEAKIVLTMVMDRWPGIRLSPEFRYEDEAAPMMHQPRTLRVDLA